MRKVNRAFDNKYLTQQYQAIRWLYEQGFTLEEIREFSMRNVDESERVVMAFRDVDSIVYDMRNCEIVDRSTSKKSIKVPINGSGLEYFFLKMRFKSSYLFTREEPKSWRREIAEESLYSLSEIRKICSSARPLKTTTTLTNVMKFANIEIAKLNITKAKSEMVRSRVMV